MNAKFSPFPCAITSPDIADGKEAIIEALRWAMGQDPDHKPLVSVADKKHISAVPILGQMQRDSRFAISTRNRLHASSYCGPVIAVDVLGPDMRKVPVKNVTALCVVPWGLPQDPMTKTRVTDSGIRPWVEGMRAETVGGEQRWSKREHPIEGFSQEATGLLDSLNDYLYGSMSITGNYTDVNMAKKTVTKLHAMLGRIPLNELEAWAWSRHWGIKNLDALLDYANRVNNGGKLRLK